jgi:transposase
VWGADGVWTAGRVIIGNGGLVGDIITQKPITFWMAHPEKGDRRMGIYWGIDLGARDSHIGVIDEDLTVLVDEKVGNRLPEIVQRLEPYKEQLQIAVETTFNWYWLVDGLQEAGYDVRLAHASGVRLIHGSKIKTDPRDAVALAKLLKAGLIPPAYIYPRETRPVRDLLRRRHELVEQRAGEYGSLRRLLLRQGILEHSRNSIKAVIEEDLSVWFADPRIRLHAQQELERIALYTRQIDTLERDLLATGVGCDEYRRLMTLPGVGPILALTVYYEVGAIERFADVGHFSSYCRLIPGVRQSSGVVRRGRHSNQGNPYLKWTFTQAALAAVRYDARVRRYFQRQEKRHRGYAARRIAYNIVAHKLAIGAYQIWRHGAVYDERLLFGA